MSVPAVMLVSHSSELLGEMTEALKDEKIELFLVKSGEEAFLRLLREPVNLVICEFRLPKMNGIELADRVRKLFYGIRFLIIIDRKDMTSYLLEVRKRTYFFPIFYKPIEPTLFQQKVKKILREGVAREQIVFKPQAIKILKAG